ncbi:hypothetical protein BDQ17DRAFT_1428237 [Cyathus striatus]|nr:hypothetical protein BDQ17DRAFT_1428237 [Cyathus striatus]
MPFNFNHNSKVDDSNLTDVAGNYTHTDKSVHTTNTNSNNTTSSSIAGSYNNGVSIGNSRSTAQTKAPGRGKSNK